MSEFRTDPIFGDLCLVAKERADRPRRVLMKESIDAETPGPCPLCPGNESMSPPEVARISSSSGWQARAFPNRYPAVRLEEEASLTDLHDARSPLFSSHPGFGAHEVLVASPSHLTPFWDLDPEERTRALTLIQNRIRDLYQDARIRYTQVFMNHGAASGATLEHPHFQLLGLPFVPSPIQKLNSAQECLVCRLLFQENSEKSRGDSKESKRHLSETDSFLALADFAPRYPYQFSIYPKKHDSAFHEISTSALQELSDILGVTLRKLYQLLGSIGLNLVLYTAPSETKDMESTASMHWFIRISPRVTRHAGFEISTKIPIIQVSPEDFSQTLRNKNR